MRGYAVISSAISRWQTNPVQRVLSAPCSLRFVRRDFRFARQHVRPRALARIADKGIALHAAHDRMRRHGNMDHARSALWANRFGIDNISR